MLSLITALIVTAFYVNHPRPEVDPDTPTYLAAARHILAHGQLTDSMRLPGYPLLIAVVFVLAGRDNVAAVSMVQGSLFVLVTLEVYVLCVVVWGLLLVRSGARYRHSAETMGVLALLALYDIVLVALGGDSSYGRLHAPVLPLLTTVVWSSILVGGMYVVQGRRRVASDARPDTR